MGKLINISMLSALITALFWASADANKKLKFHFYVQDYVSDVNEVARSEITSTSPTTFGLIRVTDMPITATPDANSTPIGRVQGIITFADLYNNAPNMDVNIVFTSGTYNGSVLIASGKNPVMQDNREMAIVGGTGLFSGARGKVISNFYSTDLATGYFVLEYSLTVIIDHIGISTEVSDM